MKQPVLVIMAAGMGSRYGGLKQIDPIDEHGNIIMDFSIFDAKRAGFEKVVFIIKKENEADFKEVIGNRIKDVIDVEYAFQNLYNLPEGYEVPMGREKPWGTAHVVLSCMDVVDGPFAVINADDYYGRDAFIKGFIEGCAGKLTSKEIGLLPMGAKVMTYECGMRFLSDYLQGDVYFKVHRAGQNLDRARTHIKLIQDMETKWDTMNEIVKKARSKC